MVSGFGLKMQAWLYRQPWLRFLLSESAVRRIEIDLLQQIKLCYNELSLSILHDPSNIATYFSEDVCRKSFSGSNYPDITELDYYYLIKCEEEVVGFIRAINLFFDTTMELHGSYGYKNNSHIKSYFFLSKSFLCEIVKRFPNSKITTVVNKNNKNALHFSKWLGFVENESNENVTNMIDMELDYTLKEKLRM